ncbi:MAG: hypothetical protein GY844_19835 [Bradyrhizobium sp.]|nr:hypothetical protein [Bradyrhizobium sp.]
MVEETDLKLVSPLKLIGDLRVVLVALMLAAIAMLTSGSSVFAGDYSVEIGVDGRAGKDAGTVECVLDDICTMRLDPFGLKVTVYVPSRERHTASVSMYGDEADCCYFDGAARSIVIVPGGKLSRLPIYLGRQAKGAFFIQNEHVGILYLRIHRR